jgi:hypothetical protein
LNKIAFALLVMLLASSLPNYYNILAETVVTRAESLTSSDIIWTKENSPYMLLETITFIGYKEQLTIEPGVIVNLNGNTLKVNGTLIAKGAQDQKIFFKNGSVILDSQSSKIDNAVLLDSINITINSGEPVISNSYIQGNLTLNGGSPIISANIIDARVFVKDGSPTISNNIISDGIHADAKGGPVTISNNEITSKSGFTVIYIQGVHADITGNKIVGNNNEIGIQVWLVITSVSIVDNQISNCTIGIWSGAGSIAGAVSILRNVIFNNDEGLHLYYTATVKENTIAQNRIGVRVSQISAFSQNNLQYNSELNMENMPAFDIDAANNWWGTADMQSISQTIVSTSAQVFFFPFLSEPNTDAPEIPVNQSITIPTPPPDPTSLVEPKKEPFQPVLITVLATILTIVCVSLLAYLKRHK